MAKEKKVIRVQRIKAIKGRGECLHRDVLPDKGGAKKGGVTNNRERGLARKKESVSAEKKSDLVQERNSNRDLHKNPGA